MEDPFPVKDASAKASKGAASGAQGQGQGTPRLPNVEDEAAFPSLSSLAPPKAASATPGSSRPLTPEPATATATTPTGTGAAPAWGPAIRAGSFHTAASYPFTQTFALSTNSIEVKPLHQSGGGRGGGRREEEPKTLGEVMKLIIKMSNGTVQIESSRSQSSGLTTFAIKGKTEGGRESEEGVGG
ncbi:hypothetical protein BT69DRAFT_658064 [Atractiella rhizophila]|nr:hypothetical protein BT69DRAFT_658064 [Atractiella rhizophila]